MTPPATASPKAILVVEDSAPSRQLVRAAVMIPEISGWHFIQKSFVANELVAGIDAVLYGEMDARGVDHLDGPQ